MFSTPLPHPPENRAVYEILSKNVVDQEDVENLSPARGILDK